MADGRTGTPPAIRRGRNRKTSPIGGATLAYIALGMASGHLQQTTRALSGHLGKGRTGAPLVAALEHMRSACGWLTTAATNPDAA